MSMFRKPEGDEEKPVEEEPVEPAQDGITTTVPSVPADKKAFFVDESTPMPAVILPSNPDDIAELEKLQRKVKHLVQERSALTAEVRQLKQLVKQQS